ncbi:DUF3105 domain-containing protein [Glycomyces buryatensis]|uniref:DUF3105 domain-containing protein n=1 Tax=Glycomyces buryatensis TaxID=2570927 RepID=A0A4S8QEP4_9ACTN|nr:DUF3105 domain-containing protein [Glycomyces buryatensis]THV42878.1 DUF3105 domain-containing protein [Glycomyces buryatensis]
MHPLRHRLTALASVAALATLGFGCSQPDPEPENGEAAEESTAAQSTPGETVEIDGVENFYGEHGDYVTAIAAINAGDITAEDLEYPFVVQQDHVDASGSTEPPTYEMSPPAGGNHLSVWQTCTGSVYDGPVADGNAVHSMEHGAVWLTYDPELVDAAGVAALAEQIGDRDYSLMSPYPGQGVAVSLQSWGNRYQTEDVADPNIEAYLDAYILNPAFNPEPNATCEGGLVTTVEA